MIEYSNSEIEASINEYIHSERDRAILKRRLIDGIKCESLAEEFDLSDKQIRNILKKNYPSVFNHIKK